MLNTKYDKKKFPKTTTLETLQKRFKHGEATIDECQAVINSRFRKKFVGPLVSWLESSE